MPRLNGSKSCYELLLKKANNSVNTIKGFFFFIQATKGEGREQFLTTSSLREKGSAIEPLLTPRRKEEKKLQSRYINIVCGLFVRVLCTNRRHKSGPENGEELRVTKMAKPLREWPYFFYYIPRRLHKSRENCQHSKVG